MHRHRGDTSRRSVLRRHSPFRHVVLCGTALPGRVVRQTVGAYRAGTSVGGTGARLLRHVMPRGNAKDREVGSGTTWMVVRS